MYEFICTEFECVSLSASMTTNIRISLISLPPSISSFLSRPLFSNFILRAMEGLLTNLKRKKSILKNVFSV